MSNADISQIALVLGEVRQGWIWEGTTAYARFSIVYIQPDMYVYS